MTTNEQKIKNLEKARKAKEKRRKDAETQRKREVEQELANLKKRIPVLEKRYHEALDKAVKANSPEQIAICFNQADTAQSVLINANARLRRKG